MPNLDFFRSIAVLLVVAEHLLLALHVARIGSWNIAWLGIVGVFMFFVHTSTVLMWSLERRPMVLDFYIRRAFRIYPLAIAAVIATELFHIPTMQSVNGDTYFAYSGIKNIVSNLLLVQNMIWPGNILGVMWTLPLEVDMYFLLPYLYFLVRRNFALWPILSLCAVTMVYARSAFPAESNTLLVCIPYFLPGVMAYVLFGRLRPRLPAFLLPVFVAAFLTGFMLRPSWRNGWLLTLGFGLVLPLMRQIRATWLIRSSHHIAKYSYGIYLVHPFSIALGVNVLHRFNLGLRMAAVFGSMALIVVPAYHLLEKPMIDLGSRLAGRLYQREESLAPAG